jgi:hypothetical protein
MICLILEFTCSSWSFAESLMEEAIVNTLESVFFP